MTVDVEMMRWVADQSEEVLKNFVPLIARALGMEQQRILNFIQYVRDAADAVIDAIEIFVNFPVVFGAPGENLTDADGKPCPDCPNCGGYEDVVFALKAEKLRASV